MPSASALINRITIGALIVIALSMVTSGVWLGMIAWSPTPVWDQWDAIAPEQLKNLIAPHNEHRIAMTRAISWIDIVLTHGTGVISLSFVYIYSACHAVLLLMLARWTWPDATSLQLVAASAIVAALFFSGFQFENFVSGFQNQFTGVFFYASVAIVLLCVAATKNGSRRSVLIAGAALAALAGCVNMANGLLIAPLLAVLAVFLGLRIAVVIMAVISAVTWSTYFIGLPGSEGPGIMARLLSDPLGFVANLLAYLGGQIPNSVSAMLALTEQKVALAGVFGAIALAGFGALVAVTFRTPKEKRPYYLAWNAIGGFVFATAAVTALGRAELGNTAMLASRYGAGVAAVWSVLFIWLIMSTRGPWRVPAIVVAVVTSLTLAISQIAWIGPVQAYKMNRIDAEAALLSQADAPGVFLAIFPSAIRPQQVAKWLRSRELSMYYEPWRRLYGEKLNASGNACGPAGAPIVSPQVSASGLAWQASVVGTMPSNARAIAILHPNGTVVGLLVRGGNNDTNATVFGAGDAAPRWSGYIRLPEMRAADVSLQAVNSSGNAICRLEQSLRIDPESTIGIASPGEVGNALGGVASIEGVFPPDGYHATVGASAWRGHSWGSWAGDDKHMGKVSVTVNVKGLTRVAVPIVTGPSVSDLHFEASVDGVLVKSVQVPADLTSWAALEIIIPPNAEMLTVVATDASAGWGGWLAIGEPRAMCDGPCAKKQCPQLIEPSEITRGASGGFVDASLIQGSTITVTGWAGDRKARAESEHVIAVADGRNVIACVRPSAARPDVAKATGILALANSGFSLVIPNVYPDGAVAYYSRQFDGKFAPLDRP